MENFLLYGNPGSATGDAPLAQVFYTPAPATAPAGWTAVNWRAAITQDHVTGADRAFASQFKPNRSELFPIFSGVLNQNYNLRQDFGL